MSHRLLEKNSAAVRKHIEGHAVADETGEEYEASVFGGFGDYFRRKKIKLQNLDAELRASARDQDKPRIFQGVVAHVSGYTQPPLHVLHKELVQHGAGFLQYLDGKTMATHIIASALPPKKAVELRRYRIVKPAWVVDSIRAGKLMPWADYRVIEDGPRQKTIEFGDGGMLLGQTPQKSQLGYREQTQHSFYTMQLQASTTGPGASDEKQNDRTSSPGTATMPKGSHKSLRRLEDIDDDAELGTAEPASLKGAAPAGEIAKLARFGTRDQEESLSKPVTSEEHNALLLRDAHLRKSTTANPDFLKQYYSESRLHHLSAWKAELKSKMQRLAAEKDTVAKVPKCKPGTRRYVMHVDFDCFFCAVSLQKAAEYADKPAVVAHGNGGGSEIASCNYAARAFGVKNGMWMKRALELCPDIKVLPYDFPAYEDASRLFYEAVLQVGGVVQSVSIDEALIDVTKLVCDAAGSDGLGQGSIWTEQEKAGEMAKELRLRIKDKTGCHVSVGIGANILLAKVALRKAKPAGHYHLKPEEALDVLGDLKVQDLPGVAFGLGAKLEEMGVRLVKDLRRTSKERLRSVLGPKTGEKLSDYARGIDSSEVGDQPMRKSVSAEVNWGVRFIKQEEADEFVRSLSKELERRLLHEGVKGTKLTLKIMRRALDAPLDPAKRLGHGKCDSFNKSVVFGVSTNSGDSIGKEAVAILRSYHFCPGDIRGLGVQLTRLEAFKASPWRPEENQKKLDFGPFTAAASTRAKTAETNDKRRCSGSAHEVANDPIAEDPMTPRKPKVHPALALAKANEADDRARTWLNLAGTQFLLPASPDPAVIAELPNDIRSKLRAQGPSRSQSAWRQSSRPSSPALVADEIPSDFDAEVFNALPDDMKAEVLASYGGHRGAVQARGRRQQTLLPQSPRKNRVIQLPRKTSPTKRRGRGGIRSRVRGRDRHQDAEPKLFQTSFLKRTNAADHMDGVEELDPGFLAELPEDVRREIQAEHRRRKLARRSGLGLRRAPPPDVAAPVLDSDLLLGGHARLPFAPRPPKISFTGSRLTSLREIQEMLGLWHAETANEGPHRADVEVLETHLRRLITEARDMDMARKLVVWLGWLVEDEGSDHEQPQQQRDGGGASEKLLTARERGRNRWRRAMASVRSAVQEAMRSRGLADMDLG